MPSRAAYYRQYRLDHPERTKAYEASRRLQKILYHRAKRIEKAKEYSEYDRKRNLDRRCQRILYMREWRLRNPGYRTQLSKRQKALTHGPSDKGGAARAT